MQLNLKMIGLLMACLVLGACKKPDHGSLALDNQPISNSKKAAQANVELGLGYLAQGQVSRAKTKLVHAVQLAPELPEVHSAMAYFLETASEMKDAEKEHLKAIKLDAGSGVVYNNYGAFLCRGGRLQEADVAFRKAIADKNYARTAEVYENAGLCALKWPDNQKAEMYFKTALLRDSKRPTAYLELAHLNFQAGNYQQAQRNLQYYKSVSDPSARSVWLGIRLARIQHDEDREASLVLTLKNVFWDSEAYQMYLQSLQTHP